MMAALSESRRGYLMPIGGTEDKTRERHILNRFVQLCGGPDNRCEVIGSGGVTIVDGSQLEYTDVHSTRRYDRITTLGMIVHVLMKGCCYDLETRQAHQPATLKEPVA